MSQELVRALRVIVLTGHIREYLEEHDPMALLQAYEALGVTDGWIEEHGGKPRDDLALKSLTQYNRW